MQTKRELCDPILTDVGVQTGRIVVSAGLSSSEEACRSGTETGTAEQEALFLSKIAKSREGRGVVVVDNP